MAAREKRKRDPLFPPITPCTVSPMKSGGVLLAGGEVGAGDGRATVRDKK